MRTIFNCIAAISLFAFNDHASASMLRGQQLKNGGTSEALLLGQNQAALQPDDDCITDAEAKKTIRGFMDTVDAISKRYYAAGGGPAGGKIKILDGDDTNMEGCKAAYKRAIGALKGAYGYNLGPVLFKPTYTAVGHTYRPTIEGALSYFIGTECLLLSHRAYNHGMVYPADNADGTKFQEYGFGINNYGGSTGWSPVTYAEDFEYNTGGKFCHAAVAMGRVCFVENNNPRRAAASCVDKTFGFVKGEPGLGQFSAVFTSHHSSGSISDESNTICQEPIPQDEFADSLNPDVGACVLL